MAEQQKVHHGHAIIRPTPQARVALVQIMQQLTGVPTDVKEGEILRQLMRRDITPPELARGLLNLVAGQVASTPAMVLVSDVRQLENAARSMVYLIYTFGKGIMDSVFAQAEDPVWASSYAAMLISAMVQSLFAVKGLLALNVPTRPETSPMATQARAGYEIVWGRR